MSGYYFGDELGAVKHIQYSRSEGEWKPSSKTLLEGSSSSKNRAIQKLAAFKQQEPETLLAAARADGSSSVLSILDAGAEVVSEWKEPRLKDGQRFVGLAATSQGVYTCTSNGALRLMKPGGDGQASSDLAALPMRLTEWRLSEDQETFAYAGDEVELSVWNTERAFLSKPNEKDQNAEQSKKRKRSDQLLPGEVWRAKNLPNDNLNLRQPVRNTALTYLQPSPSSDQHHLLVGTQFGDVRRYDTRAARRPVSNWKGIGKVGGVGLIEKGSLEHEVYVADCGSSLYALDLRNGKISYGYKGLSGSISSLAISPSHLVSGCKDRFLRLHSTFPPPTTPGRQQEQKGEILDKLYVNVVPTAIVLDTKAVEQAQGDREADDEEDDPDKVWDELDDVDSEDDGQVEKKTRKSKKKSRTS